LSQKEKKKEMQRKKEYRNLKLDETTIRKALKQKEEN
jgi:hypothetical protein